MSAPWSVSVGLSNRLHSRDAMFSDDRHEMCSFVLTLFTLQGVPERSIEGAFSAKYFFAELNTYYLPTQIHHYFLVLFSKFNSL